MAELPGARGGSGRRHGTVPGQSPTYSLLVLGDLPGWWDGSPRDWPRGAAVRPAPGCPGPRRFPADPEDGEGECKEWPAMGGHHLLERRHLAGRPIGRHDHI